MTISCITSSKIIRGGKFYPFLGRAFTKPLFDTHPIYLFFYIFKPRVHQSMLFLLAVPKITGKPLVAITGK